jgi:predicted RNase H-like HicB family nuclease
MSTRTRRRRPRARGPRRRRRTLELTAAYLSAHEGGYTAEIDEVRGVHSQGQTFAEARANLHEALSLMLGEAPAQFGIAGDGPPPGALLEIPFVVVPA